uniref:Uncharacterized protein n=1 Tax=viral metagenome TaxID=1070528 RepID=A0A6M3Y2V0_9ZZZZ
MIKPEYWEIKPDEYLGEYGGYAFFRIGSDVFKTDRGFTRFLCTAAVWPQAKKLLLTGRMV